MTQEALKMALDALETELSIDWGNPDDFDTSAEKMHKAIAAIKEALAQEQEPPKYSFKAHWEKDGRIGVAGVVVRPDGGVHMLQDTIDPPEQEPVAWRTFDGEGGYDYRSYEDNESYADDWSKRNPNHKGWVEPLYTYPPQPEQEPIYQYQMANGSWIDQTKESHDYNVRHGQATVRVVHTAPPQLEQEPVADDFFRMIADRNPKPFPLPQRTWVGLTDEELHEICNSLDYYGDRGLVQLIEAKLKEKNS